MWTAHREHDKLLWHRNSMAVMDFVLFWKNRQLFTYNRGPHAFVDMVFLFDITHVHICTRCMCANKLNSICHSQHIEINSFCPQIVTATSVALKLIEPAGTTRGNMVCPFYWMGGSTTHAHLLKTCKYSHRNWAHVTKEPLPKWYAMQAYLRKLSIDTIPPKMRKFNTAKIRTPTAFYHYFQLHIVTRGSLDLVFVLTKTIINHTTITHN